LSPAARSGRRGESGARRRGFAFGRPQRRTKTVGRKRGFRPTTTLTWSPPPSRFRPAAAAAAAAAAAPRFCRSAPVIRTHDGRAPTVPSAESAPPKPFSPSVPLLPPVLTSHKQPRAFPLPFHRAHALIPSRARLLVLVGRRLRLRGRHGAFLPCTYRFSGADHGRSSQHDVDSPKPSRGRPHSAAGRSLAACVQVVAASLCLCRTGPDRWTMTVVSQVRHGIRCSGHGLFTWPDT